MSGRHASPHQFCMDIQNKDLRKFAFRKSLILRDVIFVVSDLGERDACCFKARVGSKPPNSKRSYPKVYNYRHR